jgi:hypothetical protein
MLSLAFVSTQSNAAVVGVLPTVITAVITTVLTTELVLFAVAKIFPPVEVTVPEIKSVAAVVEGAPVAKLTAVALTNAAPEARE